MNDKTTDIILKDIIKYHDRILNKLKSLIDNEHELDGGILPKTNKLFFTNKPTNNPYVNDVVNKYKILKKSIRPDIERITLSLLSIIKNAVTEDEFVEIYHVLSKSRSYYHEKNSIELLLNRYHRYGKRHFMHEIIQYYFKYVSYLSYPRITVGRPVYADIYNRAYIDFLSIKSRFNDKSIFILDWFKLREGRIEGGSNSPSMAKVMASAIRNAIIHTGDPSLKSVWGYFENYTITNALVLDTGIHDIYQETRDYNDEVMSLEEQKLVMTNTVNGKKREIKYRSLYHVIKNVKNSLQI